MDGQTDGIAVASTALAMWRAVKIKLDWPAEPTDAIATARSAGK